MSGFRFKLEHEDGYASQSVYLQCGSPELAPGRHDSPGAREDAPRDRNPALPRGYV
jgi:hypothetical protein